MKKGEPYLIDWWVFRDQTPFFFYETIRNQGSHFWRKKVSDFKLSRAYYHLLINCCFWICQRSDAGESNIQLLTGIFFMFTFLAATHDICVDGWALTMLSKENLSWGSTCESVGGTAGWFIGNVLFLVIESAEFSNKYIRKHVGLDDQPHGIVPIDSKSSDTFFPWFNQVVFGIISRFCLEFMFFFGMVYVATATFVLFFKREISKNEEKEEATSENNESLSLFETYKIAWKIVCLKPIHKLIFCMFTLRVILILIIRGVLYYILGAVTRELQKLI